MYEVWLGINIVYEIALSMLPQLIFFILFLMALYGFAWRRTNCQAWKKTVKPLLYIGIVSFFILLWFVPVLTSSSITEVGYWMDTILLAGFAVGFTVLVMIICWPILTMTLNKSLK